MKHIHFFLFALLLWTKPGFAQTTTDMLADTGFDVNDGTWTLNDPGGAGLVSICTGSQSFSPPNCACINQGQGTKGRASLTQAMNFLPGSIHTLTFSFRYRIVTSNTTDSFDMLEVKITNSWSPELPPILIKRLDNRHDVHPGYEQFVSTVTFTSDQTQKYMRSFYDLFTIEGIDSSGKTAFYIDDVRYQVTSGPPLLSFEASDTVITAGDDIYLINKSLGTPTYIWTFYDGSPGLGYYEIYTTDAPDHIRYMVPGKYAISLMGYNGFGMRTLTKEKYITVLPKTTGIESTAHTASIAVYPNPATEVLTVYTGEASAGSNVQVSITNMHGQNVLSEKVPQGTKQKNLDVSGLSSGMYIISLQSPDLVYTQKIVKK